ncbi:MAG: TPM domain-containing protein [Bacillus subtilis]|nr:TPM domain-containing protein [Bacillus subtilis]
MANKFRGVFVLAILIGLVVLGFQSCQKREYPRPSAAYYVNDYADVLSAGVTDSIVFYGENMYESTKGEGDGRSQIVVATFMVESVEEIANYDRTEIYREWEIGENDMGILVLLFFEDVAYEGYTFPEIRAVQIELGYRMEQYVSIGELGDIVDDILLNYDEWDYNLGVMNMYLELLHIVYRDAYEGVFYEFEYDMVEVAEFLDGYSSTSSSDSTIPMTLLLYLISPNISLDGKIFYGLFALLFLFLGGGIVRNVGGGGSSGGGGIFRRRR